MNQKTLDYSEKVLESSILNKHVVAPYYCNSGFASYLYIYYYQQAAFCHHFLNLPRFYYLVTCTWYSIVMELENKKS